MKRKKLLTKIKTKCGITKSRVKKLAKIKLRYIYATSWFNIIGVPLLVANLLQEKLVLIGIKINFLIILIVGVIFIAIAGYIMDMIGLFEEENTYAAKKNKEIQAIKKKLEDKNERTKK